MKYPNGSCNRSSISSDADLVQVISSEIGEDFARYVRYIYVYICKHPLRLY